MRAKLSSERAGPEASYSCFVCSGGERALGEIDSRKAEVDREKKRKEREEVRLKELKVVLEKRQGEMKSKHAQVTRGSDHSSKLEMELREQKQTTDRALKEVDMFVGKLQKLNDELKEQVTRNAQIAAENISRTAELSQKQTDIKAIEVEAARMFPGGYPGAGGSAAGRKKAAGVADKR